MNRMHFTLGTLVMFERHLFSDQKFPFCAYMEYWYNMCLWFFVSLLSCNFLQVCTVVSLFFPINSAVYDVCIMLVTIFCQEEFHFIGFLLFVFQLVSNITMNLSLDQYMQIFSDLLFSICCCFLEVCFGFVSLENVFFSFFPDRDLKWTIWLILIAFVSS